MPEGQESEDTSTEEEFSEVEETQEPVAQPKKGNTNDSITASLDEIDDVDTLKNMVRRLRTENGNHRRKNKAQEDDITTLKEFKVRHFKGLAEAEERVEKAEKLARQFVVKAVALEFDIDDDLVDLIDGRTEEEIYEKAEKLANTKKREKVPDARNPLEPGWVPGPTQLMPGKRGNPVKPTPQDENQESEWFNEFWRTR